MLNVLNNRTPAAFFLEVNSACDEARAFCNEFPTMRDAWLAPNVNPAFMLWLVGNVEEFHDRLLVIGEWLRSLGLAPFGIGDLDVAKELAFAPYYAISCDGYYYKSRAARYAYLCIADHRKARARKLILKTFPEVFNTETI